MKTKQKHNIISAVAADFKIPLRYLQSPTVLTPAQKKLSDSFKKHFKNKP